MFIVYLTSLVCPKFLFFHNAAHLPWLPSAFPWKLQCISPGCWLCTFLVLPELNRSTAKKQIYPRMYKKCGNESDFCPFLPLFQQWVDFSRHVVNIIGDTASLCVQSVTNGLVNLIHFMKSMGASSFTSKGTQADTVSELRL